LRGGSRGEASELVFASVPPDVWEKGPAAANAWIEAHLPKSPDDSVEDDDYLLRDRRSFEKWLNTQEPAVAVAFAVRVAMRALPLTVYAARRYFKWVNWPERLRR